VNRWFERYLPFVARSRPMQVTWLASALRKGVLSHAEIAPYIRLLLTAEEEEEKKELSALLSAQPADILARMVAAADIYDAPKLIALIQEPDVAQAMEALCKEAPPYEENPHLVQDRVFQAIHAKSPRLLEMAVEAVRSSGRGPRHFEVAYQRFCEKLEDEKLLSALYPRARVESNLDFLE